MSKHEHEQPPRDAPPPPAEGPALPIVPEEDEAMGTDQRPTDDVDGGDLRHTRTEGEGGLPDPSIRR